MDNTEYTNLRSNTLSKIVGCAFESYNYWHWGVDELVYEAGLLIELQRAGFEVHRQEEFPVYYKGIPSAVKRRVDLLVNDKQIGQVVIELKSMEYVGDAQRKQLWSYMKLLSIRLGMLINFGPKGVYSERYMLDEETGFCQRF